MLPELMGAGYAAIACAVLLGTLGAPLPLGVALTAMGALAREGHLQLSLLFLCSVGAAALGDNVGYWAGRLLLRLLPRATRRLPGGRLQALLRLIERHGDLGMLIFLTRWSLTAPSTLVNLLAGYRRYRWSTFAAIDLAGQAIWVALALAPGYLLGGAWGWGMALALVIGVAASLLCSWLCRRWLSGKERAARPELPFDDAHSLAA